MTTRYKYSLFFHSIILIFAITGLIFLQQFFREPITLAKEFYVLQEESLSVDEYFLLQHIFRRAPFDDIKPILTELRPTFINNPFSKIFNSSGHFFDLSFTQTNATEYQLPEKYEKFLEDPWDGILLRTLYCDKFSFTNDDFLLLYHQRDYHGGYADTHVLLGLLFLKELKCFDHKNIVDAINLVSHDVYVASNTDQTFSDLYVERLVFLSWAGKGNLIKDKQIDFVKKNQESDGGWSDNELLSNLHTTGLSTLVLLYDLDPYDSNSESLFIR